MGDAMTTTPSTPTQRIYNVPVDTDRMRFVSKMYQEGSEAEIFLFNGAAQIEKLTDELAALEAKRKADVRRCAELVYQRGLMAAIVIRAEFPDCFEE